MKKNLISLLLFGLMISVSAQNLPNVNTRVLNLISQLTFNQKISQMINNAPAITTTNPPINAYHWWNEGLHGICINGATVFPQAIGLSSTWDVPLMTNVATAISDEARGVGNGGCMTYWSPNINIFRDPRWGRGQETYGEDPYLTSRMGIAFIRSFQGNDSHYLKLVATPKHDAVYSGPEPIRHEFNAITNKRDLWETYLPAFKAAIVEAKAYSIMGSYGAYNGVPACANPILLDTILRKLWNFRGYVVSDCEAITDIWSSFHYVSTAEEAACVAIKAGCDLECGSTSGFINITSASITKGLITQAQIDTALFRLFKARFLLGEFDPAGSNPYSSITKSVIDCPAHRALALQAAQESMVLLKNKGILPLNKSTGKIAVIGPNADTNRVMWGNYNGTPSTNVTPLKGLHNRTAGAQISYMQGCAIAPGANIATILPKYFKTPLGASGVQSQYFNNKTLTGIPVLTRTDANIDFNWGAGSPGTGVNSDGFSARFTFNLTPDSTGAFTLSLSSDDGSRLIFNGNTIIDLWGNHGTQQATTNLYMIKGKSYNFIIEYYDNTLSANVNLSWGMSLSYPENLGFVDSTYFKTPTDSAGLKGEYFTNISLSGTPALTRTDKVINFNWGLGSPNVLLPSDSFSIRWTGTLQIDTTADYTFTMSGDDGYRLFINNNLILGDWTVHPVTSNSATINLQKDSIYNIRAEYFENTQNASVTLEWSMLKYDEANVQKVVDFANNNDVVVFVGGISPILESESGQTIAADGFSGGDRTNIELPKEQDYLLKAIQSTGKPIVLVLMSGSCLAVNWENDSLPAILQTWYSGEEGGNAIADVLFGNYNPAGRLPITYYKSVNDVPAFTDLSMDGPVGRTYRYFKGNVLYPFGYGLSYSSFDYSNLNLPIDSTNLCKNDTIPVIYTIKNIGAYDGDEVVQLYAVNKTSKFTQPIKQLKAFKRIHLAKGEIKTDTLKLDLNQLFYYDTICNSYQVEPGTYELQLGASSQDIRLKSDINLSNCDYLKYCYTADIKEYNAFQPQVYPNPTNDLLYVRLDVNPDKNMTVELYDVVGKKVFVPLQIEISGSRYTIDMSGLQRGIYFLKMTAHNQKYNTKIVKQ